MAKKMVNFRLEPALLERLMRQAEKEYRTATNMIEALLSEGLEKREKQAREEEKTA